jgi:hypothetical protein
MTRQYLVGEMSLMLADLQEVAGNEASAQEVARLRRRAEMGPLAALGSVAACALELVDSLCQDSLDRGDAVAFASRSTIGAELRDFSICAGLLDEVPVHLVRTGR